MNRSCPEQLTNHVTVFGDDHFRHYLVGEYQDALIECGATASANYFAKKLAQSGQYVPD